MHLTTLLLPLTTLTLAKPLSNTIPSLDPTTSIKNLLSHCCLILDTKTYPNLSQIYTSDAVVNFTTIGLGVLNGLSQIEATMNSSLYGIPTQHAMTSSYVEVGGDWKEASGVTYYTLEQFGTGSSAGTLFTVWGKWVDQLILGSEGWRIKNRQVVVMGGPLIGSFVVPTH